MAMPRLSTLITAVWFLLPLGRSTAHADCFDYANYLPYVGGIEFGYVSDLVIKGKVAYVAGQRGLQVIDVSNPAAPRLLGGFQLDGGAGAIAVSESFAYLTWGGSGFAVFDVSDPTAPSLLGTTSMAHAGKLEVSGAFVYVASWDSGLQIVDVSNPRYPQVVGSVRTLGNAYDVAISGTVAYVVSYVDLFHIHPGFGGLEVIDVSNPMNPRLLRSINTG